jgi:hypothetical protein
LLRSKPEQLAVPHPFYTRTNLFEFHLARE